MEGSTEKNTSLRVASFSYYLDTASENSFHKTSPTKLVFNVPNPPPFTFPQEPRKDGEISVFGADKYFSMKVDYQMGPNPIKNQPPAVTLARTPSNPGPRAPSFSSEASSCTSQTAFLRRNGSQTKQKKSSIFSGFGCKQPCFNKKDVRTPYHGPKPVIPESRRISSSFPAKKPKEEAPDTEPPRASLEVFGSKTPLKGEVAKNMERKLSILTWDAIPNPSPKPSFSAVESSTVVCDDMASEVSSDLFEIENISGSRNCASPASHYAPSEASIQWSVVTGSAADYAGAADIGHDEKSVRVTAGDAAVSRTNGGGTFGGGIKSSRSGGLLGCRSLKGVDVSGSLVCKGNIEKGKHEGLDLSVSFGKSQTNRKRLSI